MRTVETLAFNVKIPELTGDYEKDMKLFEEYMKQVNFKVRLLEELLRKEIQKNGR